MFTKHNRYSFRSFSSNHRRWRQSLRSLGIASLFSFSLMGGQPGADAAGTPPVFNLYGRWGFSGTGTIVPPAVPEATPMAVMGIMTFDGKGGCSIADTLNVGGNTASRTSKTCTYTVNLDGTGSLEVRFAEDPGPLPLSFVIVDGAEEIKFIGTSLLVGEGSAKRM